LPEDDRSIAEVGGELLAVSQFTLYADTRRGSRGDL
jgi:D-Tyr-tRNAtyr deacylase